MMRVATASQSSNADRIAIARPLLPWMLDIASG